MGYAVLLPNPRGSTGYGQEFCKAIFADWGNKDYQDDMAFVDFALAQGLADPDKLGVGGWSYGGISTDFIIGQTNRFKAAITGAGGANFTSRGDMTSTSANMYLSWAIHGKTKRSGPHRAFYRVKDILTPTLFVGGNMIATCRYWAGSKCICH